MLLEPVEEAEFENTYKGYVPQEGEIRIVANRNLQCSYYLRGIDVCRKNMIRLAGDQNNQNHQLGFLPCKRIVDAHYRCLTEEKYGNQIEEVPQVALSNAENFFSCTFKELKPMVHCRKFIDGVLRDIYRSKGNKLDDSY